MIIDTGGLTPEQWRQTPQGQMSASGPVFRKPMTPRANPHARASVEQRLHRALVRLYPDSNPSDLLRMAKQLAGEYIAERENALLEATGNKPDTSTLDGGDLPANYQGEWRWDGNKIVPVDSDYLASQQRITGRPNPPRPLPSPGAAQPIQTSQGTPYGERMGDGPGTTRTANFQDADGDGTDDRYQAGPGQPRAIPSLPATQRPSVWGPTPQNPVLRFGQPRPPR